MWDLTSLGYSPHVSDNMDDIVFSAMDIFQIDGMSNLFWGWGQEDDDMYTRIMAANLKVVNRKHTYILIKTQ